MNITIIGASAGIGLETVKRGLNRADVADFLIKQAENQTELKKYIAISEKQNKVLAAIITKQT